MKLRPYQEEAADFLFANDRAMMLAPVGAGKTATTPDLFDDGEVTLERAKDGGTRFARDYRLLHRPGGWTLQLDRRPDRLPGLVRLAWPGAAGFALGSLLLGLPFTAITFYALQEARRIWPQASDSFAGLLTAAVVAAVLVCFIPGYHALALAIL